MRKATINTRIKNSITMGRTLIILRENKSNLSIEKVFCFKESVWDLVFIMCFKLGKKILKRGFIIDASNMKIR